MNHFTMEELEEMRQDAIEEYEHAVDEQMFDDEESDYISELRSNLEWIMDEIYRKKTSECYCYRNDIGVPGVSCGDCPEMDYPRLIKQRKGDEG